MPPFESSQPADASSGPVFVPPTEASPRGRQILDSPGLPRTWQRLHPLSPVVRSGPSLFGIVLVVGTAAAIPGRKGNSIYDLVFVGIAALGGVVSWAVTRWRVDGDTLRVETGLIRRQSLQVPLSRTQAVDLVEPLLARILGLAEVRVRTGGVSRGDARLCYLRSSDAIRVRAGLLAVAHGLHESIPAPPEERLVVVPNVRLVAAGFLTGVIPASIIALIVLAVLGSTVRAVLVAGGGGMLVTVVTMALSAWRRISTEWSFTVADAPDGLRIRSGLLSRSAETVPRGRIQAVRMVEPLWFRPLGWCRLELHLAGGVKGGDRQQPARVRRALLPVGPLSDAALLLSRVLPEREATLTRPPRRAMIRAPLSYHFLQAGIGEHCAVAISGRIRRETEWVPLAKIQSLRAAQGPIQRSLRLASVHLDAAGRHTRATLRDRAAVEAVHLLEELPARCAAARDESKGRHGAVEATGEKAMPAPTDRALPDA
jgi:putative membrane protein